MSYSYEPKVSNKNEADGVLRFNVEKCNVSVINAIRRIILSDIPSVVFRTTPYERSLVTITKNTTRLNNEIMKQRLSCIPIHITDTTKDLEQYEVVLHARNDTHQTKYITTKDFKIRNITSDAFLTDEEVQRIFPANSLTKEHIIIGRLRPKLSDDLAPEELALTAKLTVSTAREDSGFNVVSTCAYACSEDPIQQREVWNAKEKELRDQGMNEEDIVFEKKNWTLGAAKRVIAKDTFEFSIESVGVFTNESILEQAIDIMLGKLKDTKDNAASQSLPLEEPDIVMKAYDIRLDGEDYTLGKALEYAIYTLFYEKQSTLSFVGFRKHHPHDDYSVIRIAFNDETTDKMAVYQIVREAITFLQSIYQAMKDQLV